MKSSLYEYRDYKDYFMDLIDSHGRGRRKELAEHIGCQVSHITNVLSGSGHFSQEQAESAARFFGLHQQETEFLLLLVQYTRAGTKSLKNFYEKILADKQDKYLALKSRLKMPDSLRSDEEVRYYSSWQFGAVHVLVSISEFQTREAIAKKLDIPLERIDEILNFLVDTGLCKKEQQKYLPNRPLLHLDKSSPLISKHHTNWRLRSILSFDEAQKDQVHYSSVFTLAKKDYHKVREIFSRALSEAMKVITASPEEEAAVICLDLFPL